MQAEAYTARVRQRIYETANPILFGTHQFTVLPSHWKDSMYGHRGAKHLGNFISTQSGTVHQTTRFYFSRRAYNSEATTLGLDPLHLGVDHYIRALLCGDASVCLHEFLTSDNARGRNLNRLEPIDVRFTRPDVGTIDDFQVLYPIRFTILLQCGKF